MKGAALQSQRPKLLNENVGSSEFCGENIQSSKSQVRKSKTPKHGRGAQTGANVDITELHEDKSLPNKFETNRGRRVDYEVSDSKPATSSCYSCAVGIAITTKPGCSLGEAPSQNYSDRCVSTVEPSKASGERVVPDAVDVLHRSVTTTISNASDLLNAVEKPKIHDQNEYLRQSDEVNNRVLSPVGEEPGVCLARSEVNEVSTVGQNLEEPVDKPSNILGKRDHDLQSVEHRALQLRFGTVDVVASDVQVPVNLKPSSTSKASHLHRTVPELQVPKKETPENGRKLSGLSAPRIKEKEGWIAARDVEATPEQVYDSNSRRSGLRSQSLPSGVFTPGMQHALFTSLSTTIFLGCWSYSLLEALPDLSKSLFLDERGRSLHSTLLITIFSVMFRKAVHITSHTNFFSGRTCFGS